METGIKRPLIVSVTQIALLLFSLFIFMSAAYLAFQNRGALFYADVFGVLLLKLVFACVPLVACWALTRRKGYGLYLALGFLAFSWIFSLVKVCLGIVGAISSSQGDIYDLVNSVWNIFFYFILVCLLTGLLIFLISGRKRIIAWVTSSKTPASN